MFINKAVVPIITSVTKNPDILPVTKVAIITSVTKNPDILPVTKVAIITSVTKAAIISY